MAYKKTNYQQEMVEVMTDTSNYSTITKRSEDEAIYSEIKPNETIQNTTDHQQKELMFNSKIKLGLVILGIITLAVSSCILTVIILKQKIDSLSNEIESMKLNTSRAFVYDKPVIDQESNWLEWTNWSDCSAKCSGGIQRHTRTCDGSDKGPHVCVGNDVDIAACNNNTCVGIWTTWSSWKSCSVTCGVGLQRRGRTCTQPTHGPHGSLCVGDNSDFKVCTATACEDKIWSTWSPWGDCSVTCNGGMKTRTRTCDGTDQGVQQVSCLGNNLDIGTCNNNVCVESNWLKWTNWSDCSAKCSGGIQRRTRTCDGSDKGPHVCVGNDVDIAACNNNTCVGIWTTWSFWKSCSVTCGVGLQRRGRTCTQPTHGPHGSLCVGNNSDFKSLYSNGVRRQDLVHMITLGRL